MLENKLKKMSVTELENIIAKAISEATGEEFVATIPAIDYKNGGWPEANFNIRIAWPMKFGKSESEENA